MTGRVAPFVGKFAKFVGVLIITVRKLDKIKHVRVTWHGVCCSMWESALPLLAIALRLIPCYNLQETVSVF